MTLGILLVTLNTFLILYPNHTSIDLQWIITKALGVSCNLNANYNSTVLYQYFVPWSIFQHHIRLYSPTAEYRSPQMIYRIICICYSFHCDTFRNFFISESRVFLLSYSHLLIKYLIITFNLGSPLSKMSFW